MNDSQKWEQKHWRRIFIQLENAGIKLSSENIPEIIEETSFRIRSKKYPEYCTLYEGGISCHPQIKDLNCFLCACPQYNTTTDEGKCEINSKFHKYSSPAKTSSGRILDCTDCAAYHTPGSIAVFLRKQISKLIKLSETL